MQRTLVILAVFLLVTVALLAGALASHWPFWARAWQWQMAASWPDQLPGPTQLLQGGGAALPLHFNADTALLDIATGADTRILLRADADGRGDAFLAPGYTTTTVVDGRGLTAGLLPPLYGMLTVAHPGLLDAPVSNHIDRWLADRRGRITPRQLLSQLSGLPAGDFQPLNAATVRAQLASGPDFVRAALHWKQTWPAGSHFEESPVNAQLLATVAARLSGSSHARVLEQLWSQMAAADAVVLLDHPRGNMAAHCCLRATAADWLRLGLLLADDGRIADRQLLPAGFVSHMAVESPVHPGYGLGYRIAQDAVAGRLLILETPGRQLLVAPSVRRALLWVGAGPPPARLQSLLGAETARHGDKAVTE